MLKGHCECGGIRLNIDAPIDEFSHCHCAQCRRLHGAAYATFARVPRDALHYECGEALISRYASSKRNDRLFCAVCGSNILFDPRDEPAVLYISMSVLEGNPPHPEGFHTYVRSKAPWHDITDGLPQFDEEPPEPG